MGTTTFTGPIRAGNILNTSGNVPGNNIANVGQTVMAQSYPVLETSAVINAPIAIPAGSQILSIAWYATVPFTNPVSIGNQTTVDFFSVAAVVGVGEIPVIPNDVANWINTGTPDSVVSINGGAAPGSGSGVLTITYLQGPNGNA